MTDTNLAMKDTAASIVNAGLLKGKKGLIFGVANDRSIAWGISQAAHTNGAELAFTYLGEIMQKRVVPLAESVGSKIILPCDAQKDEELDNIFAAVKAQWGELDFVVHSIAFAHGDDLKARFSDTSRAGFSLAMDVSAYSLLAVASRAAALMPKGGSILTLSSLGANLVVLNYKIMGVAKAALEACVRELSVDLGGQGIRVNAISAGPIKTLAASGIPGFRTLLGTFEQRAPLKRLVSIEDVGNTALYYLSDLSQAVTGEIHYVDAGFNVTAL